MRRVVVTGLGVMSPVGNDVATFFNNLVAGRSGIGRHSRQFSEDSTPWLTAEVKPFSTEGFTKMLIDPESERILGVGIVGISAGDLLSEAVLAIEMGATARDISETIHPHPTLSETVGNVAEVYLGFATEIYRPKPAAHGAK